MPFTRYVPQWSGFSGAPGFSVMHLFGHGTQAQCEWSAATIRAFFLAQQTRLPNGVTVSFPAEMTEHSDDGTLTGVQGMTSVPAPVTMTGTGNWAAPVGARLNWDTNTIVGGKRLRGALFLVPLVVSQYDAVGTLASTTVTGIQGNAQTMLTDLPVAGLPLAVWSPTGSVVAAVTSPTVPDRAAVMRSRRD